jgi:putative hydrolase of the HAD superfamily
MAIKAIFFDWFNTLARYEPARDESALKVLHEFGFEVPLAKIQQAISVADKAWFAENAISPIRTRNTSEQAKAYARHHQTILTEAGVNISGQPDLLINIITRMQTVTSAMHFVLFDDVLPTVKSLKERKLIVGILTNLDRDMKPLCRNLGIEKYVNVIVTSGEIGVDKPNPLIFQAALQRANVTAPEAILVGDQYKNDILGARGVGIKPLLIDRDNQSANITDCPHLKSLTEVVDYLS